MWSAFWINLRRLSLVNALILFLAIVIALASDLIGNAIIAGTGVGFTSGPNNTVSNLPFVRVGYADVDESIFESDVPFSLFTSADFYPQLVQFNDSLALLPVQAGGVLPASYSGVAYFGTITSNCAPAKLNGSIFLSLETMSFVDDTGFTFNEPNNAFVVQGDIEIPFDNLSAYTLNFGVDELTLTQSSASGPSPLMGVWTIPVPNTNSSLQYLVSILLFNLSIEGTGEWGPTTPSSSGLIIGNDSEAVGAFLTQVCRLELPSSFGTIFAPHLQQNPLPPWSQCRLARSLCPNITIYDIGPGATVTTWSEAELLTNVNASYTNFQTVNTALAPLQNGVIFCRDCNTTNIAARVLSAFVVDAASSTLETDLANAFKTVALHAVAFTYRNELPTLNGLGTASFSLLQPATLIVNPTWIYCAVAYVWVLIIVMLVLRWITLGVSGDVDRSSGILSAASLVVKPSPLAGVVRAGSLKGAEELRREVEDRGAIPDEMMKLGELKIPDLTERRFGIGWAGDVQGLRRRYNVSNEREHLNWREIGNLTVNNKAVEKRNAPRVGSSVDPPPPAAPASATPEGGIVEQRPADANEVDACRRLSAS